MPVLDRDLNYARLPRSNSNGPVPIRPLRTAITPPTVAKKRAPIDSVDGSGTVVSVPTIWQPGDAHRPPLGEFGKVGNMLMITGEGAPRSIFEKSKSFT